MKMHMDIRQSACAVFVAMVCSVIASSWDAALAQAWPTRIITVIVPFTAGSTVDVVARVALDQVSKQVGQPIVFENRGGAGGTLGANIVAKAAPDGHTILTSGSLASAHALHQTLPYDTLRDFAPLIPLGLQPLVLVTAPSKGFKTLGDLIAAAKARPNGLNFASAGVGSATHLAAERLRVSAKFEAQHIPFRGPTEALAEIMAGRVDFYFLPIAPALALIKEGRLVALAVSGSNRAAALPEVPTTTETGLVDSAYLFSIGLFLPARTPSDVVVRFHQETEKALQARAVQERLATLGVEPMPMSLERFDKYFRDDVAANVNLVRAANIPMQ